MNDEKYSPKEVEVLNLLTKGNGRKEISKEMNISYNTLNVYFKALYGKTKTNHINELTVWAIDNDFGKK